MPGHAELRPLGQFFTHVVECGAGSESERMATQIDQWLAVGMRRQFELLAVRREDVRGVEVLRVVARSRELRQQIRVDVRRRVHGARGYTIGWLGTASPPMAGTASDNRQGP